MKIETCCQQCVFAEYNKNTQTGCLFGRLDKFRENGVVVEECYSNMPEHAEKSDFFVVHGLCSLYRMPIWASNKGSDIEELKKAARKEVEVKVFYMVHFKEPATLEDLERTVKSIQAQYINPTKVTIINRNNSVSMRAAHKLIINDNRFEVSKPVGKSVSGNQELSQGQHDENLTLNRVSDKVAQYYVSCDAGFEFAHDFSYSLDKFINDELQNFGQKEFDGVTVTNISLHKMLNNNPKDFLEAYNADTASKLSDEQSQS